ncbi:hypothetical protein D9M69_643210 [compost metagenome]
MSTARPASGGSLRTQATPTAGSGWKLMFTDLKFTSRASGEALYGRRASPSNAPGSLAGSSKSLWSSTMSPSTTRTPWSCKATKAS